MEVAMIKLMNNCRIGTVFTIDRYLLSNSNYLSKRIDFEAQIFEYSLIFIALRTSQFKREKRGILKMVYPFSGCMESERRAHAI